MQFDVGSWASPRPPPPLPSCAGQTQLSPTSSLLCGPNPINHLPPASSPCCSTQEPGMFGPEPQHSPECLTAPCRRCSCCCWPPQLLRLVRIVVPNQPCHAAAAQPQLWRFVQCWALLGPGFRPRLGPWQAVSPTGQANQQQQARQPASQARQQQQQARQRPSQPARNMGCGMARSADRAHVEEVQVQHVLVITAMISSCE